MYQDGPITVGAPHALPRPLCRGDDGLRFHSAPQTSILEKGSASMAHAIARGHGGIEWTIGRKHGLGIVFRKQAHRLMFMADNDGRPFVNAAGKVTIKTSTLQRDVVHPGVRSILTDNPSSSSISRTRHD